MKFFGIVLLLLTVFFASSTMITACSTTPATTIKLPPATNTVSPTSTISVPKQQATYSSVQQQTQETASFYIPPDLSNSSVRTINLKVVKVFSGQESSATISYKPEKYPYVINAQYFPTSSLSVSFNAIIVPTQALQKAGIKPSLQYEWLLADVGKNTLSAIIDTDRLGNYFTSPIDYSLPVDIKVVATGCNWKITIGQE